MVRGETFRQKISVPTALGGSVSAQTTSQGESKPDRMLRASDHNAATVTTQQRKMYNVMKQHDHAVGRVKFPNDMLITQIHVPRSHTDMLCALHDISHTLAAK
jgi:hypothetical protein